LGVAQKKRGAKNIEQKRGWGGWRILQDQTVVREKETLAHLNTKKKIHKRRPNKKRKKKGNFIWPVGAPYKGGGFFAAEGVKKT